MILVFPLILMDFIVFAEFQRPLTSAPSGKCQDFSGDCTWKKEITVVTLWFIYDNLHSSIREVNMKILKRLTLDIKKARVD